MYNLKIRPALDKKLKKMSKRDTKRLEIINNKVLEIRENPQRYKNLRAPMQHLKRVHINRHFVLVFSVDEENKTVILEDYEHHDKAYL